MDGLDGLPCLHMTFVNLGPIERHRLKVLAWPTSPDKPVRRLHASGAAVMSLDLLQALHERSAAGERWLPD